MYILQKWQRDILTQTALNKKSDKPKAIGKEKQTTIVEEQQPQPEPRTFFPNAKALENAMRAFKRTQPKERLEASHAKTKKRMQQVNKGFLYSFESFLLFRDFKERARRRAATTISNSGR